MACPKCKGLMAKKLYIRPSEVFKLGPGYFNASQTAEYYIEAVWTCTSCGHREVKWHYSHSAPSPRVLAKA